MKYADNFYSVVGLRIKYYVITDRKTENSALYVVSFAAHIWVLRKRAAFFINPVKQLVSGLRVIFCNIVPDLNKISPCLTRV